MPSLQSVSRFLILFMGALPFVPATGQEPPELERVLIEGFRTYSATGSGSASGGSKREPSLYRNEPVRSDEEVAANRFRPACQREAGLMQAVESAAKNGTPPATDYPRSVEQAIRALISYAEDIIAQDFTALLSGGVKDPQYQDPSWTKMKVIIQGVDKTSSAVGYPFLVEIHYWHNADTNAVEQLKLKNTKEEGCQGQITSVG